jgi:hypothetical protein
MEGTHAGLRLHSQRSEERYPNGKIRRLELDPSNSYRTSIFNYSHTESKIFFHISSNYFLRLIESFLNNSNFDWISGRSRNTGIYVAKKSPATTKKQKSFEQNLWDTADKLRESVESLRVQACRADVTVTNNYELIEDYSIYIQPSTGCSQ